VSPANYLAKPEVMSVLCFTFESLQGRLRSRSYCIMGRAIC